MVVKDGGKSQKIGKNLLKTAEDLCRRTLIRDVDEKKGSPLLKEKQRTWDNAWENQKRIQILGDSNLIANWINGEWKINNQKFRKMVQRTQNMLDKTGLRPVGDHLDMFQHVYREWNQEADRLTHVARGKGATWNSYVIERGARVEAVRSCFDCAKILTVDATVMQAECTAAVEAARAICCLARAGCICLDLDGKLIEDYNENKTRKRNEMKADSEGRWKKKEEISRPSHSLSSSFQVDICDC